MASSSRAFSENNTLQNEAAPFVFRKKEDVSERSMSTLDHSSSNSLAFSFGNSNVRSTVNSPAPVVQPKLEINQPGDKYEQEADAMAEKVIRMPEVGTSHLSSGPSTLQRKCSHCEEEEKKKKIQRKETGAGEVQSGNNLSSYVNSLGNSGAPLSKAERDFFEPRFGYDFSKVRIHTENGAAISARSINALAYTSGNNIVFDSGQYNPSSVSGKKILAHELGHVLQQNNRPNLIQRLIRTPYPWTGVITPKLGANIRSSPDSSSAANLIDSIPKGKTVKVIGNSSNWLKVESDFRGPLITGYIHHTLVDDATSASMSASVGTRMAWRGSGPGSGTDFETWASAAAEKSFPAVTTSTIMNCWEAVLLSAYRAKTISWAWIHNLYTSVPVASWVTTMSRGALTNYSIPGPNLTMPQRGDIVFFNGISHVALATGNGSEVYTFWPPPDTPFVRNASGAVEDRVKLFTIEALAAWWTGRGSPIPTIQFGTPNW